MTRQCPASRLTPGECKDRKAGIGQRFLRLGRGLNSHNLRPKFGVRLGNRKSAHKSLNPCQNRDSLSQHSSPPRDSLISLPTRHFAGMPPRPPGSGWMMRVSVPRVATCGVDGESGGDCAGIPGFSAARGGWVRDRPARGLRCCPSPGQRGVPVHQVRAGAAAWNPGLPL